MKAVIFAGGVGTRLWPLSRKKSPKQFEKIVGDKSTIQIAVDNLLPDLSPEDIYVATGKEYVPLVVSQLSNIPKENIIGEPSRQDVGPAVAFWMGYLSKKFPKEPVFVSWSDQLIQYPERLKKILRASDDLLKKEPERIIFLGHKPRFASENLGWIDTGSVQKTVDEIEFRAFQGIKYRPQKELAEKYFADPRYCWNLGSFVSTPLFIYNLFERFAPKIYKLTEQITAEMGKENFEQSFKELYAQMPQINLDNALSEQIDVDFAYVVVDDIGWSDVGAWEALKEALEEHKDDNVTKGKVMLQDSSDTLIYNYDDKKLIVGIDLNDFLVVNTDDVLLVAKKSSVPKVKKMVEGFEGTAYEKLT